MLRCGLTVSSAAVETASNPTKAKKIDAAAAEMPATPSGAKGVNCSIRMTGSARTTNTVSAAILIATRTALMVALSRVPTTRSQVTRPAMPIAGRLISPPSIGPSTRVSGMSMWKACSSRPTT